MKGIFKNLIIGPNLQVLVFVDDITVIGDSQDEVTNLYTKITNLLEDNCLYLKPETEIISTQIRMKRNITKNDQPFILTPSGEVLGIPLGEEAIEIKANEILDEMKKNREILKRFVNFFI